MSEACIVVRRGASSPIGIKKTQQGRDKSVLSSDIKGCELLISDDM